MSNAGTTKTNRETLINYIETTAGTLTTLASAEKTSFIDNGYYSIDNIVRLIPSGSSPQLTSGLKVFMLNTNACDNRNINLYSQTDDPGGVLAALKTFLAAGRNNYKVWIVGNTAPGGINCNTKWAVRYNWLIEAYQDVVLMQVFGSGSTTRAFHLQYPK